MGLLAWYPLNGDTRDYSGNGNDATNYGAAVGSNGKIGKCYEFNNSYMTIPNKLKGSGRFSISFWMKQNNPALWTNVITFNTGESSNCGRVEYSSSTGAYRWYGNGCFPSGVILFEHDGSRWDHITLTCDGDSVRCYKNGVMVYVGAKTTYNLPDCEIINIGRRITTSYWAGSLNDIRIYDHALSTKEIKEIAKAKILHYTFDDFQEPTVNLVQSPEFQANGIGAGWGSWEQAALTYSNLPLLGCDTNVVNISKRASGSTNAIHQAISNLTIGKDYSLSFYARVNPSSAVETGGVRAYINSYTDFLLTKEWTKVVHVQTATGVSQTIHLTQSNASVDIQIAKVQLEEKDHATPFTPSSRSGKIKDISGYNNDAALSLATTPQWVNDSKIGGGAYKFSALNTIEGIPTSGLNNEEGTVSMWIKPNFSGAASFPSHIYFFRSGGKVFQIWNSNGYLYWLEGWTYNAKARQIVAGQWYHIVATWKYPIDNTTQLGAEVYIDAVPYGTIQSATPANYGATGVIGGNFDGVIDDVRIYATALSQQDIEELYKTRASIDDGGNLYAAQILENTEPTENIIYMQNPRIDPSYEPYVATASGTWTAKHPDAIKVYNEDGTQITGYINSGVTDWTNTYHAIWTYDEGLKKPVVTMRDLDGIWKAKSFGLGKSMDALGLKAGDKYTISWLQWTDNISRYANAGLYGLNISGANGFWDGQSNTQATCRNTLAKTWQRVYAIFTVNANRNMAAGLSMFMYGHGSPAATIKISDVQMEKLDHPTPFTHKIRLQSTDIPVGHIYKNTVESNGCLGYEDISEVGITNGLVAYYPFDKDAKDYSGYGNHGTLNGIVTTVGGVDGNAKLFKVAGDKMAINSISGDALTLCAWHKWDTTSTNWRTLFGNTGNYHHLMFNNDRSLNIFDGSTRKFNYSVPDNNWHHYVVVINSEVNASLYVDGVFNSTITIALNLKTYPVQFIGNYGGNSYPCGTLDEVRIYDRPLAAEEVTILYDTTRPDKPSVKLTKDMLYLSGELKEGL